MAIRPDLHFCKLDDKFILLCLRSGRYSLLAGETAHRFDRFRSGQRDRSDIEWLAARGLLAATDDKAPVRPRRVTDPVSGFLDATVPAPTVRETARAIINQFRVRRALRVRTLAAALAPLREFVPGAESRNLAAGLAVAAAFHRARRYVPAIDQCLVRGIAMKRRLDEKKVDARLVLGVTLPFSAHCWVQAGEIVLTDPIDVVRPFKQILVI